MTERLRVFVASSSEQLEAARAIANALTDEIINAQLWTEGTFKFSDGYIESLEDELMLADFAVVVLTADDVSSVRTQTVNLPRDNVIFELGLFMGSLGRKRSFFLVDRGSGTRIPTDLEGVHAAEFSRDPSEDGHRSMQRVADQLRTQMVTLGNRRKWIGFSRKLQEELWRFSAGLAGSWWQRIRRGHDDEAALSFVTITADAVTGTPKLEGSAYNSEGTSIGEWHTFASHVTLENQPRLLYYWEGTYDDQPGETRGGRGNVRFQSSNPSMGEGDHYDTTYASIQTASTRSKKFAIYRCSAADVEAMKDPTSAEARRLIAERLERPNA